VLSASRCLLWLGRSQRRRLGVSLFVDHHELQAGKYYRLAIQCDGTDSFAVGGAEFFRNMWINKIEIEDVVIAPLGLDSISFDGEGEAEISFIPIRPGTFTLRIPGTTGETQDISMTPALAGEVAGFNLAVGGTQGSGGPTLAVSLDAFVRPEEAAEVCATIALIFRDHGPREARSRARLAFLIEDRGAGWMRDELVARLKRPLPAAGRDARVTTTTDHVGIFRRD